jgi:uncharacterized cupredoxin-like copper-binding protein
MKSTAKFVLSVTVATAIAAFPIATLAHGDAGNAKAARTISTDKHPFGVEGDPKNATRTVAVAMDDTMRYSQQEIRVAQGETVTFVITNKGKLLHELVFGTEDELRKHAELMRKNPGMEHDEPYMAHVKAGRTEKMTWKFTNPGTFLYGCLVPGHFEAGMKGKVVVTASK